VVALELPATLVTTAGATIALPFGGTPLAAAGPVTLSFAASADVSLSWDADSDLRVSSTVGAAAITSGSGAAATLSLYGTAAQLNAYLSAGKLKASLSGTSAGSVSVTLNSAATGIKVGGTAGNSITVSGTTASASALWIGLMRTQRI
jgi:hypothetical protein